MGGRLERIGHKVKETFKYTAQVDGEEMEIDIVFVDGKYDDVEFEECFDKPLSRDEWEVMAEIELEIGNIEREKGCVE